MQKGGIVSVLVTIALGFFSGMLLFGITQTMQHSKSHKENSFESEGFELLFQGKYEDAADEFESYLNKNSNNFYAYTGKGWAYYSQGNYDQAQAAFLEARKRWRGQFSPAVGLSLLYTKQQDTDKAISVVTDTLQFGRGEESASKLYTALGLAYLKKQDFANAVISFKNAHELHESLLSSSGLMYAYSETGNTNRVEELFQTARRKLIDSDVDVTDDLNRIYYDCIQPLNYAKERVIACVQSVIEDI